MRENMRENVWIKVSDALPEKSGTYLVAWDIPSDYNPGKVVDRAEFVPSLEDAYPIRFDGRNEPGWIAWDGYSEEYCEVNGVTHWMRLPAAPEVDG